MSKSRSPQWIYIILDHVFCLFVTAPLVPSFWRGSWFLYGHYVFPSNSATHGWVMTAIGNLAAVPLYLIQNRLVKWLGSPHPVTWLLGYHMFLFVFTLISVAQWKGVWELWDYYTGRTVTSAITSVAIAVVILTTLKCCKSVAETAPLAIAHDISRDTLLTPTRFNQHKVSSQLNINYFHTVPKLHQSVLARLIETSEYNTLHKISISVRQLLSLLPGHHVNNRCYQQPNCVLLERDVDSSGSTALFG